MALTITDLFNDATTREIGGVGPDQVNLIVSDLIGVQQGLNAAFPQITDLTSLHAHVIANQLNEEIATVENANSPTGTPILGTNLGQYVGRAINDIHRDIIDIAQADPGLQAVFNPTPLPALNTPPAPFHDDATQTAFLTQFIQDSNHLGQAAVTIENNGFNGDIAGLVQQLQTFEQNANAFDQSQGGLWSARFWNELRADGTAGTAANALIDGLQTHNAGEVNAAAQQLAMNASDVAGNNLMADGGSYSDVIAAAQASAVAPAAAQAAAGGTGAQASAGASQDAASGTAAGGTGAQASAGASQDAASGTAASGTGGQASGASQDAGSGTAAGGTGAQASAGGASQDHAAGSSHGSQAGADGAQAQASAGELQVPGAGGTHTPQAAPSGADGRGWSGVLHDLTAAAAKPHENFADFTATTDPTHASGVQDLMQVHHMHFAHMWAG
jgi:hypothetical protein